MQYNGNRVRKPWVNGSNFYRASNVAMNRKLPQWRFCLPKGNCQLYGGGMCCKLCGHCLLTVFNSRNIMQNWSIYLEHRRDVYMCTILSFRLGLFWVFVAGGLHLLLLQSKSLVPETEFCSRAEYARMSSRLQNVSQNLSQVIYIVWYLHIGVTVLLRHAWVVWSADQDEINPLTQILSLAQHELLRQHLLEIVLNGAQRIQLSLVKSLIEVFLSLLRIEVLTCST